MGGVKRCQGCRGALYLESMGLWASKEQKKVAVPSPPLAWRFSQLVHSNRRDARAGRYGESEDRHTGHMVAHMSVANLRPGTHLIPWFAKKGNQGCSSGKEERGSRSLQDRLQREPRRIDFSAMVCTTNRGAF
jgi:hypothetical protein